ncbi:MAG: hypothetical protein ACLSHO_07855 [Dysosmobacter sp.]
MFDCAQDQVDALKADGCEYIICLGHLGIDEESTGNRSIGPAEMLWTVSTCSSTATPTPPMKDIAEADRLATGKVSGTLLTSTGTKLESVGVVTIRSQRHQVTAMSAPLPRA